MAVNYTDFFLFIYISVLGSANCQIYHEVFLAMPGPSTEAKLDYFDPCGDVDAHQPSMCMERYISARREVRK